MTLLTLRARYVFPVDGRPIPDGAVSIEGERIVSVGPWVRASCRVQRCHTCGRDACTRPAEVRDLGNVAILPGLVNAHVHLDFSDLAGAAGSNGASAWSIGFAASWSSADRRPAATAIRSRWAWTKAFARASPRSATSPSPAGRADVIAASPLRVTVFQELIAPTADRVAGAVDLAKIASSRLPRPLSQRERGRTRHISA